jgi:NNP family nitrate/nitrite transporter-like MFS transporter
VEGMARVYLPLGLEEDSFKWRRHDHRRRRRDQGQRARVLWMSTIAFTLMFAVWLMFGILGVPIQKEFGLTDPQLAWLSAVAVLNGSLWRLPAGMLTDRIGGRVVTIAMLLLTAIPCFFLTRAGLWRVARARLPRRLRGQPLLGRHRVELGVDAEGAPGLRARRLRRRQRRRLGHQAPPRARPGHPRRHCRPRVLRDLQGRLADLPRDLHRRAGRRRDPDLRHRPAPRQDGRRRQADPRDARPLKHMRVWRFSLYYAAVFGAYVALSAWLPKYYVDNFGIELKEAALLTATFIFPASLLRPVGAGSVRPLRRSPRHVLDLRRHAGDDWPPHDAQRPHRHRHADGSPEQPPGLLDRPAPSPSSSSSSAAPWASARPPSTSTSPSTSPTTSAPSAASSGCSGASAASSCRRCSPTPRQWSGFPTSTFFVLFLLTAACAIWMHWTVVHMLHKESPDLARHLESPSGAATAS